MTTADPTIPQSRSGPLPHVVDPPVVEYQRPAGTMRTARRDVSGLVSLTLRLIWRHWPVLLSLALAGTLVRELLLSAAIWASNKGSVIGFFALSIVPIALLVAMVLMLRTVRPSLPRIGPTPREPVIRHVGSVLVPFIVFYSAAEFLTYDILRYSYGIAAEGLRNAFVEPDQSHRQVFAIDTLTLVVVSAGAFVLRWTVNRFGVVRRRPVLGVPAAYLEVLGIWTAILLGKWLLETFGAWLDRRVVWQAGLKIWRDDFAALRVAAGPLREIRDYLTLTWATAAVVIIVPVTALLAAATVLAANTAALYTRRSNPSRLARMLRIGGRVGRPIGRLGELTRFLATMRLAFRSGIVFMMAFCLLVVAAFTVDELLMLPERWLIGPQPVREVWELISFPLDFVNQAIGLVLILCILAAAVERSPLGAVSRAVPAGPAAADATSEPWTTPTTPTSTGGQQHVPRQL